MTPEALEEYINSLLSPEEFDDYAPSGIQVQGNREIRRLALAVTAGLHTMERAVAWGADAILAHHGLFWGRQVTIRGYLHRRIKLLMEHDVTLLAYHLPLDAHPEVGNAAALFRRAGITPKGRFGRYRGALIGMWGECECTPEELHRRLEDIAQRPIQSFKFGPRTIRKVACVTGGGDQWFEEALEHRFDAFITGEIGEPAPYLSMEMGGSYYALGHDLSESFGVQDLGARISDELGIEVRFFPPEIDPRPM